MPTSPCGCGRHVQAATAPRARHHGLRDAGAPAGAGAGARWKWRASWSTATRCRACRTPLPRRWRGWRPRSTSWRARSSTSAAPSSWARSCSTRWACPAARRARPAPMPPAPTCWRIWRPSTTCPRGCWTGGSFAKLKSTYTDALQDHINPETGRVHTSYSIAGANTGRLASTDPNLQNIPVRTEEGRRIREAFVAEPGQGAGQPRLQPDRAAHPRPCRRGSTR
jgi:hypothetical protein